MTAQFEQTHAAKGGFWRKLNSWWDGEDHPSDHASAGAHASDAGPGAGDTQWSPERLFVLRELFGAGLTGPWSPEIQDTLIRELQIEENSRIVVLGGGFGGPAQRLQAATGAKVLNLDDRVEVSDIAQEWLAGEKAAVQQDRRDFFDTGLKPDYADVIIAFGGLSHVRHRKSLYQHMLHILRPNGKLVVLDFFITGRDPTCPEVAIWSALEDRPRHLMNTETLARLIYEIGFDTPEFIDVTGAYRSSIRSAFGRSMEILKAAGPDAVRYQQTLVSELERWNRRLALLDSGEVRFYAVRIEYFGKSAVV